LGLAYAAIHDYRSSVEAFSLALSADSEAAAEEDGAGPILSGKAPSDLLLLAIAQSYMALEDQASADMAKAYLVRCVETTRDSQIKIKARLLLGLLFRKSGAVSQAEEQYLKLLEESGENAEGHFQLGELYAAGGDSIKARAEWRRAVRIDPAHRAARQRLNM
jgi:tetratricopeptide (TPR) repeat protein